MRNQFRHQILTFVVLAVLAGCAAPSEQSAVKPQVAFFNTMTEHCGSTYLGVPVYPDDPEHAFYGQELEMHVASCTDSEIRIPFRVGDNTSRTWVLTLSDEGLLFKHDHRHDDGTPEDLTNYGGWMRATGSAFTAEFPADAETAEMLPEAVTNVWTMTFDPDNKQFIYYLERHSLPRFKAVFSLN
jgi:hypothetical protein